MRNFSTLSTICLLVALPGMSASAQEGLTEPTEIGILSVSINKMSLQNRTFVCGGKAQAGTPIAGLGGTSGTVTISGIPLTATVVRADLFWTVLTDNQNSSVAQDIVFAGNPISGTKIGTAAEGPCFPQPHTIAYKADVTSYVTSPGNGAYLVSDFPTSGALSDDPFVEGVTLQVLWSDANGSLMEDVLFHTSTGGLLAVTQADTFSQDLSGFETNAIGPVAATLFEVVGNGQANAVETLRFDGPAAGDIDLDNTLDGSTVAAPAESCTSSPVVPPQCFWDDDVHDVSSQMTNSATSATLVKTGGNDCFDWPALNLMVSTDEERVCEEGGEYVDSACPQGGEYKNHGAYVSCVAHAAEEFLAGLSWDGSCPRAEIQSCIVNPRARRDVGKK